MQETVVRESIISRNLVLLNNLNSFKYGEVDNNVEDLLKDGSRLEIMYSA